MSFIAAFFTFYLFLSTYSILAGQVTESWVDKNVYNIVSPSEIKFSSEINGPILNQKFSENWELTVIKEENNKILIRDQQHKFWFNKNDFLLATQAPDYFTKKLIIKPDDLMLLKMRAVAWIVNEEPDKAFIDINKVINNAPQDDAAYYIRSHAYILKKQAQPAINDLTKAITINDTCTKYFLTRALIWTRISNRKESLKDYENAIKTAPDDSMIYLKRGWLFIDLKEYNLALKDFDNAVKLDPNNSMTFYSRGRFYTNTREYEKAIQDFSDYLKLEPEEATIIYNRGVLWSLLNQWQKALDDYNLAISKGMNNPQLFFSHGIALGNLDQYEESISSLNKAINLSPENPNYIHTRASTFLLLERKEAIADFKKTIELSHSAGQDCPYSLILGLASAQKWKDEKTERWMIEQVADYPMEHWPLPAFDFLQNKLSAESLMKKAQDKNQQTDAYLVIALKMLETNQKDSAIKNLQWIKENGQYEFNLYSFGIHALELLQKKAVVGNQ